MYTLEKSPLPLIHCKWRVIVGQSERYVDPANEFWSLGFARHNDNTYSTVLVGPSIKPRTLQGVEGEEYWGIEFQPQVFIKDIEKSNVVGTTMYLPVVNDHFYLGNKKYYIPRYEDLERFVQILEKARELAIDRRILRSLNGDERGFAKRSRQRYFRKITGLSKYQILQLRRARYAFSLLQSGVSPRFAAIQAGYADQSHLTHSLTCLYAKTPSEILSEYH